MLVQQNRIATGCVALRLKELSQIASWPIRSVFTTVQYILCIKTFATRSISTSNVHYIILKKKLLTLAALKYMIGIKTTITQPENHLLFMLVTFQSNGNLLKRWEWI